jgi:hypothetical protein
MSRMMHASEDLLERVPVHRMWWPTHGGMGVGQRINETITLQDLLKGQGNAVVRESERLRLVSISRTLAASIINRGLKS